MQSIVERLVGARLPVHVVTAAEGDATAAPPSPASRPAARVTPTSGDRGQAALEHETVRHLLEVFPVEKTTIEEE